MCCCVCWLRACVRASQCFFYTRFASVVPNCTIVSLQLSPFSPTFVRPLAKSIIWYSYLLKIPLLLLLQHNKTLILNIQKLFYTINGSIRCTYNPKYSLSCCSSCSCCSYRIRQADTLTRNKSSDEFNDLNQYTETCAFHFVHIAIFLRTHLIQMIRLHIMAVKPYQHREHTVVCSCCCRHRTIQFYCYCSNFSHRLLPFLFRHLPAHSAVDVTVYTVFCFTLQCHISRSE